MAEHAWCRSPSRDEDVRAAEDGRPGPLPTLEEAIQQAFGFDEASVQRACDETKTWPAEVQADAKQALSDLLEQGVPRLQALAEASRWGKRLFEARYAGMLPKTGSATSAVEHENKGDDMGKNGLRTERVTLEVTHEYILHASAMDWPYMVANFFHRNGESVRVVDESAEAVAQSVAWEGARDAYRGRIARLTDERDTAIRERRHCRATNTLVCDERDALKARVAELEGQLESVADRAAAAETALEAAPDANAVLLDPDDVCQRLGNFFSTNEDGDRCGLHDLLGEATLDDLVDYVCKSNAPAASEWRMLGKDEYPKIGDQYKHWDGRWSLIRDRNIHFFTRPRRHKFRRRVAAPAASGNVGKQPMKMPSREWFERRVAVDDSEMSVGGLASRVAELESAAKLAPAATADGGSNHAAPAASGAAGTATWFAAVGRFGMKNVCMAFNSFEECEEFANGEVRIVPLYAAPQAANGWLTPEEREAIMYLIANRSQFAPQTPHEERRNAASRVCHALLARSTPPEVVLPEKVSMSLGFTPRLYRDEEVHAALAAAGVKVKEVSRG